MNIYEEKYDQFPHMMKLCVVAAIRINSKDSKLWRLFHADNKKKDSNILSCFIQCCNLVQNVRNSIPHLFQVFVGKIVTSSVDKHGYHRFALKDKY